MGEDAVEILAALVDDGRKADDFGARTHDDQEFQLAVVGKFHVGVVCFNLHILFPWILRLRATRFAQDDTLYFVALRSK